MSSHCICIDCTLDYYNNSLFAIAKSAIGPAPQAVVTKDRGQLARWNRIRVLFGMYDNICRDMRPCTLITGSIEDH